NVTVPVRACRACSAARLLGRTLTSALLQDARVELDLLARHGLPQAGVAAAIDAAGQALRRLGRHRLGATEALDVPRHPASPLEAHAARVDLPNVVTDDEHAVV